MRILFADDSKDTRDLFSLVFSTEGFETRLASHGVEALAAVQESEKPFDVIVLDIEMPYITGWQLLKILRQMPQCEQVPIILLTAYGDGMKAHAIRQGAYSLLAKPILPQEFVQVLRATPEQAQLAIAE
jgi:CheY-like chemotaxis protein